MFGVWACTSSPFPHPQRGGGGGITEGLRFRDEKLSGIFGQWLFALDRDIHGGDFEDLDNLDDMYFDREVGETVFASAVSLPPFSYTRKTEPNNPVSKTEKHSLPIPTHPIHTQNPTPLFLSLFISILPSIHIIHPITEI